MLIMFFFDTSRATRKVETEIPESEWVARAVKGDEDAFVHLAMSYRPRLWATASRFARSRPELEDLVQDLLLKLWRGPGCRHTDKQCRKPLQKQWPWPAQPLPLTLLVLPHGRPERQS